MEIENKGAVDVSVTIALYFNSRCDMIDPVHITDISSTAGANQASLHSINSVQTDSGVAPCGPCKYTQKCYGIQEFNLPYITNKVTTYCIT